MLLYFAKHPSGHISVADWPITETVTQEDGEAYSVESIPFEVSEEDKLSVDEGSKDWDINDGIVTTKPSDRKAIQEAEVKAAQDAIVTAKKRKFQLIQKVTLGTATLAEQEEFANLL